MGVLCSCLLHFILMTVYVTLYTEAYSHVALAPQNFFNRAQDDDLLRWRWIRVDADVGKLACKEYDVGLDTCPIDLEESAEHILDARQSRFATE